MKWHSIRNLVLLSVSALIMSCAGAPAAEVKNEPVVGSVDKGGEYPRETEKNRVALDKKKLDGKHLDKDGATAATKTDDYSLGFMDAEGWKTRPEDESSKTGKEGKTFRSDGTPGTTRTTGTTPLEINPAAIPQAGEHDDNEEYSYFLDFLKNAESFSDIAPIAALAASRRLVAVYDRDGAPLYGATVKSGNSERLTCADGEAMLWPSDAQSLSIRYGNISTNVALERKANARQAVKLNLKREPLSSLDLDIVFMMDTTGSMQDEIDMLRDTLTSIYQRISRLPAKNLKIRLGMVLYRDLDDEYVTKEFQLTANIEEFQKFLFAVEAGGGGDYPEDLLSGLDSAVNKMEWKKNAVKLVFLCTDAPAHIDRVKFAGLLEKAQKDNIKVFSIGASGLDLEGESHLRLLSQMTKGKFIFLTYGETGESSGSGTPADPGKVSHHTGANYSSRKLDDIVVDNVKSEVYFQIPAADLAEVRKAYDYKADEDKVFRRVDNALQQIAKQLLGIPRFSTNNTVLVLPPDAEDLKLSELANHVGTLSETIIATAGTLRVVDRSKMKALVDELKLKLSGMTQNESFKGFTDADMILAGKVYFVGSSTVLYLRLIDAGTSEVLAASMVKI